MTQNTEIIEYQTNNLKLHNFYYFFILNSKYFTLFEFICIHNLFHLFAYLRE